MAHRKIAVSIPDKIVTDLDYISGRMKITRSALLSYLLEQPSHDLRGLLEGLPENPSQEDILRSRGASAALINQRMVNLEAMDNDLFSK